MATPNQEQFTQTIKELEQSLIESEATNQMLMENIQLLMEYQQKTQHVLSQSRKWNSLTLNQSLKISKQETDNKRRVYKKIIRALEADM
tara:strand:+ start:552 stop:818 length:267 start_codon:yes stop_codon:yes gene_type:complete